MDIYIEKWKRNVFERLKEPEVDEMGAVKFEIPDVSSIRLGYPSHLRNAHPILRERWRALFTQFHQLTHMWEAQLKGNRDDIWGIQAAHDYWCRHGTPDIHGRRPGWSMNWLPEAIGQIEVEMEQLVGLGPTLHRVAQVMDTMHIYSAMLAGCTDLKVIKDTCRVIREQKFIAPEPNLDRKNKSKNKDSYLKPLLHSHSDSASDSDSDPGCGSGSRRILRPLRTGSPGYSPPPYQSQSPPPLPPIFEFVIGPSASDISLKVDTKTVAKSESMSQREHKLNMLRDYLNTSPSQLYLVHGLSHSGGSGHGGTSNSKPKINPNPNPRPTSKPESNKPKVIPISALTTKNPSDFYWPSNKCGYVVEPDPKNAVTIAQSSNVNEGGGKFSCAKPWEMPKAEPKFCLKANAGKYKYNFGDATSCDSATALSTHGNKGGHEGVGGGGSGANQSSIWKADHYGDIDIGMLCNDNANTSLRHVILSPNQPPLMGFTNMTNRLTSVELAAAGKFSDHKIDYSSNIKDQNEDKSKNTTSNKNKNNNTSNNNDHNGNDKSGDHMNSCFYGSDEDCPWEEDINLGCQPLILPPLPLIPDIPATVTATATASVATVTTSASANASSGDAVGARAAATATSSTLRDVSSSPFLLELFETSLKGSLAMMGKDKYKDKFELEHKKLSGHRIEDYTSAYGLSYPTSPPPPPPYCHSNPDNNHTRDIRASTGGGRVIRRVRKFDDFTKS